MTRSEKEVLLKVLEAVNNTLEHNEFSTEAENEVIGNYENFIFECSLNEKVIIEELLTKLY